MSIDLRFQRLHRIDSPTFLHVDEPRLPAKDEMDGQLGTEWGGFVCERVCVRPDLVPYRDPTPHPANTCKRRANLKRISSRAMSRLT